MSCMLSSELSVESIIYNRPFSTSLKMALEAKFKKDDETYVAVKKSSS
jgi:hypothetical protein